MAVQEQDGEDFVAFGGQVELEEMPDGLRRVKDRASAQLLGHGAAGEFQDGHQFCPFGGAEALDLLEIAAAGVQKAGDAVKSQGLCSKDFGIGFGDAGCGMDRNADIGGGADQPLGELQDAFSLDAGAQQDGQQLRVAWASAGRG